MKRFTAMAPWMFLLMGVAFVLSQLRPTTTVEPYDLATFARVPVSAEGRVKPWDTVARTSLMIISGRQSLRFEDGTRLSAVEWLLNVLARPKQAEKYPIFRIDHPDVLALIDVEPGQRTRFSFEEITHPHGPVIAEQAERALALRQNQRNAFQTHLIELYSHLNLYAQLGGLHTPYVLPPLEAGGQWQPFTVAVHQMHTGVAVRDIHPAVGAISKMMLAYGEGNAAKFNTTAAAYADLVETLTPEAAQKAEHEIIYNRFAPFYTAAVLYVGVFALVCFSWLFWREPLQKSAVFLLVLALIVHTAGLAFRIYLQGRPPVTNLYSSAVFIGWGCVILGLLLEWLYRGGLGSAVAAITGFTTLIIAHHLVEGDSMQMMQAVLDTNFWLATHVVVITIGYSAAFFAGLLAIIFIIRGVFTRTLTPAARKRLGGMIYGVICFALLMSFVGTVLGGIWADQSWGRFWGWDPKENGAALIVLMNALILHARWGGMIQQRGIAVLAVGGNIVTAWSWFGTNMLGVGLHSYGFMDSALHWLVAFVVSQLAIMAIGLLPPEWWRSERPMKVQAASAAAPVAGGGATPVVE